MKFAAVSASPSRPLLPLTASGRPITHAKPPPPPASSTAAPAAPAPTGATTLTFTLASTNPSAVPLSQIVANMPSQATVPASTTYAPGTSPTFLPGAPGLPDYSPEVQQWIQDVKNSGVSIPNFAPTTADGSCASNPEAAADQTRCWWTCGGCKADDDIEECPDKMTWGLTYDDGPALHTGDLLHYLDTVNLKATFFAIIAEFRVVEEGHQGCPGCHPCLLRPPYGDVDNRVRAIAKAMGLQTSIWTRLSPTATFDTGDFDINGGLITSEQVLNNWQNIIGNATTIDHGFIVLEHDLFQQTVDIATGYILPDALAHQPPFNIMPMVQCLKKDLKDAYLETNDNATNPIGSANPTGTGGNAEATGTGTGNGSSGASGNGSNSAMGIASPSSLSALAFALVWSAIALVL
ncbi:hypothetical protein BC628DRAFT_1337955 [Trametes gibbosa]|nr:hypothetical protein BC628DRAFT_1340351 [Trametes gibbosa]KAI0828339.1 hypothetical protein BC628DRAFT_1337955 [Trametes gibbosa]